MTERIAPRSGVGFTLNSGEFLHVIDPEGEQVSDLIAYSVADIDEHLSSGRSIDYAGKLFLSTGDILYSNRSNRFLTIVHDEVGRHDFTLTPCSAEMFRKLYNERHPHRGCQGNLEAAMARFGIGRDRIPIAFNIFMNVDVNPISGEISVLPPLSRGGDRIIFRAETDLIIGLTACSAGQSNNFRYKPIEYKITKDVRER